MVRVIDNPRAGERIVIRHRDRELLEFDVFLQPGSHVPAGHLHPRQEERFTVIDGQVRFRVGRRQLTLAAGESLIVPIGTSHWFGNASRGVAQVHVQVRPALRMQELFEASARRQGWAQLALMLLDFSQEVRAPYLSTLVLTVLGWLRPLLAR